MKDKKILTTAVPERFFLSQNHPNPFNSETVVRYQLPKSWTVTLRIINLLGQEVKTLVDEKEDAGYHKVSWNGKNNSEQDVVSGIYIYRIQAGDYVQSKMMFFCDKLDNTRFPFSYYVMCYRSEVTFLLLKIKGNCNC